MTWKCPACGAQHSDGSVNCSCGYSFCKILGIKPGASLQDAKQAYTYLQSVWQKDSASKDALLQKKARERLKKIDAAFAAFKQYAGPSPTAGGPTKIPKTALIAAGIVLVLSVLFFFLFQSKKQEPLATAPSSDTSPIPQAPAGKVSPGDSPESRQQTSAPPPVQIIGEISEEGAIDMVKKSEALFPRTMTEIIIKKWTDENAGRFKIIGWKAKKMNDQKYFVSYTALEGSILRGFYFELDSQKGTVQNIANNPELQKTYSSEINK